MELEISEAERECRLLFAELTERKVFPKLPHQVLYAHALKSPLEDKTLPADMKVLLRSGEKFVALPPLAGPTG